ncbi:MAG: hypothetical protein JWM95_2322 [Gemmatimonadetes bacterium]|nr:hypothetical protein [Gemmatimonadota bacterium]
MNTVYHARLVRDEKGRTEIDFPDCPGCQTFADVGEDVGEVAREALEGWLEAHLIDGEAPPRPASKTKGLLAVSVAPSLAIAIQVRWRRQELGLSQAQLGKKLGVSRQQVALIEQPTGNLGIATLERVAKALDVQLRVELAAAS